MSNDFTMQHFSTFVSKVSNMSRFNIPLIKTYAAISAFVLFWMMTFAYVLPINIFKQKTPKIAWCYNQIWGQKWSFFTNPHLWNERLFFVIKKSNTTQVCDSIDVLNELWKDKRINAPFNTKEDILNHIMYWQIDALKETIDTTQKMIKPNSTAASNIENFGKLMLQKRGYKIDSNTQFKMMLYSDYIDEFGSNKKNKKCILEFETSYKPFK